MKKYALLLLIPFLILSCTSEKFAFKKKVDAEVIGVSYQHIGIKYELFGQPFFQDIYMPTRAAFAYYSPMKTIPLTVAVRGTNYEGGDHLFITLYHKDAIFGEEDHEYKKVSMNYFAKRDTEIPGFTWYTYNEIDFNPGKSPAELRAFLKEKYADSEVRYPNEKTVPEAEHAVTENQPVEEGKKL